MASDRAPDRLDALLGRIRRLEKAVVREMQRKEEEFFYRVRERQVEFTAEARARHRRLNQRLHLYLRESRGLVLLTGPVIWLCLAPLLLLDVSASLYQLICFPIYGIPKVRRRDYLAFDRHHLDYLNVIEKLNCEYCAYANGILAYCTEIAARTEQYWCPIKHAQRVGCVHSRYRKFVDYGDGERYRRELEEVRRAFADITPPGDGPAGGA